MIAAATTAVLLGTVVAPGLALASGSAPTVPDVHVTTAEDTPITGNLLTDATDPENDVLSVMSHGQFNAGIGSVSVTNATGAFTFTPAANASGSSSISFSVWDGTTTVFATMYVTVTAVNDAPVCATPVTSSGNEDTQQSGTLHCTDVDTVSRTYALVDQAAHGTAVVQSNGSWTYDPDDDYNGSDSFTFKANDGSLDSNTATVNVTVDAVNDPPVAPAAVGTTGENAGAKSFDVMADVTDPDDGDTLSLVSASVAPAAGTVDTSSGQVEYTPAHDFTGDAVITYTVSDGQAQVDSTLTVTVTADATGPAVDVPTVAFGSGRVDETAPLLISWSASDISGVAGYQVQVSVAGGPFVPVYSGAGTSVTKFYAFNKSLVWRVRAQDGVGNWSDWTLSATRKLVAYQAPGNSSIKYSGTWTTVTSAGSSGTGYKYVSVYGKYAQLSFSGMSVLYIAPKLATGGYVTVYVDNVLVGKYSTYRSTTALGQIIARKVWGTSGSHTIKIVDAQSGRRIGLDAFIVLR